MNFTYMQFSSFYYPSMGFGGPVKLMYDYANWINDYKKDVIVYSTDIHHDFSRLENKIVEKPFNIIRSKVLSIFLAKKNIIIFSPFILLNAIKKIKKSKITYIHFWEIRGLIPLYCLFLHKLFPQKVRLIHSAFGQLHYKKSYFRNIFDYLFLKKIVKNLFLAMVQNNHEYKAYKNLIKKLNIKKNVNLTQMPLHINLVNEKKEVNSVHIQSSKKQLRKKYNLSSNDLILIFLGRFNYAKGINRLIDVVHSLQINKIPNLHLLIIGTDQGYKKNIIDYIEYKKMKNYISIIEGVFENRFQYYSLADIFIAFPLIYEESMLASIEALSCGLPLLLSKEADVPYIQEKKAGYIITYDLKRAVEKISDIHKNLDNFSKNARETAIENFSEYEIKNKFLSNLLKQ